MSNRFPRTHRAAMTVARFATTAAIAAGLATSSAAADGERVAVGASAPDFTLEASDGSSHQLSSLHGERKAVLVFFRGAW